MNKIALIEPHIMRMISDIACHWLFVSTIVYWVYLSQKKWLTGLVGGLEHFLFFSIYSECHHPNWRTPIFQRGRAQPPTWLYMDIYIYIWIIYGSYRLYMDDIDDILLPNWWFFDFEGGDGSFEPLWLEASWVQGGNVANPFFESVAKWQIPAIWDVFNGFQFIFSDFLLPCMLFV